MSTKKISVTIVVPILNEAKTIQNLLDSLRLQTLHPTEVILVDGGSTDNTVELINQFEKKHPSFSLRIIEQLGANRSVARNLGARAAKNEIIVFTDAGCTAKRDWLEKITKPFGAKKETQVVAGFYDPAPKNWWEDILAEMTCVRSWNFDANTFLPSSRSLAVTKKAWKEVHGYPEELETCEDLVFAQRLKNTFSNEWSVVKDAQVIWLQPKTLGELTDRVYNYALGDIKAKYERHVAKISSASWRVLILLCLALPLLYFPSWYVKGVGIGLFGLYVTGTLWKHKRMLKYPLAWVTLPFVQLAIDVSLVQARLASLISGNR